jgi:hypothetical protein
LPAAGNIAPCSLAPPIAADLAVGVMGAPGPPGWPPTWLFNGVTVGQKGDIYVTGDNDNMIYRIKVRP